jgi:hypothetical protein
MLTFCEYKKVGRDSLLYSSEIYGKTMDHGQAIELQLCPDNFKKNIIFPPKPFMVPGCEHDKKRGNCQKKL